MSALPPNQMKNIVTLFTRASCSLCDSAKYVIKRAGARVRFRQSWMRDCQCRACEFGFVSVCTAHVSQSLQCFPTRMRDAQAAFEYKEIDIAAAGNDAWLKAYQYDIPVIHLNGAEVRSLLSIVIL